LGWFDTWLITVVFVWLLSALFFVALVSVNSNENKQDDLDAAPRDYDRFGKQLKLDLGQGAGLSGQS